MLFSPVAEDSRDNTSRFESSQRSNYKSRTITSRVALARLPGLDATKIVFRSDRDAGGNYEIPAFGGDARLLAREGLHPKFSPDGFQVAYWIGDEGVAAAVPGSGTIWVVPIAGGPPQQVGLHFSAARYPIWSPDGKQRAMRDFSTKQTTAGFRVAREHSFRMTSPALYERPLRSCDSPFPSSWSYSRARV